MIHLPALIQDLAFILITAALVTLLFKKLKQPVVLGYLIAGFLMSPHVPIMPNIRDPESIKVWAEIGVIILLFCLGLEFSFKKLSKVGKSASITAVVEVLFMLGAGYVTGKLLSWSTMDSLFLGGILSISSTTIIVRAFDELGLKGRNFVSLVFGVLIIEDIVAILLLVLLSSVAVTQSLSGSELIFSSVRLGFFLVLWFVLGIYLLPIFLDKVKNLLSDETMLVVAIGLCLLMVLIATHVGFSPALGAFIMGSLLAETRKGARIEHLMVPVRDLFAAVFFVSVGMMIDPKIIVEYYQVIILITAITIFGKFMSSCLGALIAGRSLKNSVQAGMSLAQIGEFSFIIATLGLTLKVTSDFLYPIAVSVSAITTFSTPYLIKSADKFYFWIERHLPVGIKEQLARYESIMQPSARENSAQLIWQVYGLKVILNSVVAIAIVLSIENFVLPVLETQFESLLFANSIGCIIAILLSAPFLWAIIVAPPKHSARYSADVLLHLKQMQLGLSVVRLTIGFALISFAVSRFASIPAFGGVILLALTLVGLYFSRFSGPLYQAVEKRFLSNLTEKERMDLENKPVAPELAPWNTTLTEFTVSPDSELIAKPLQEVGVKEKFGVTVAMIERGSNRILAPSRTEMLLPFDRIYVIGTDDQLAGLKELVEVKETKEVSSALESFGLQSVVLTEKSNYINKTIRDCGLREAVNGLIVGIERRGQRILNPDSSITLNPADLLWVVGDLEKIRLIKN